MDRILEGVVMVRGHPVIVAALTPDAPVLDPGLWVVERGRSGTGASHRRCLVCPRMNRLAAVRWTVWFAFLLQHFLCQVVQDGLYPFHFGFRLAVEPPLDNRSPVWCNRVESVMVVL